MTLDSAAIISFWFHEIESKMWFQKNDQFDALVTQKFSHIVKKSAACELWGWRSTPHGRLAEILILDQFSRNIFRGKPSSFAQDTLALVLAQEAVCLGIDSELSTAEKSFLYMPFMHSESLSVHTEAVRHFAKPGLESGLDFELRHKAIIERFGRYPHRNAILGRVSTVAEIEFLKEAGSSF